MYYFLKLLLEIVLV